MALPLVTVRARVVSQDGQPVSGATVVALLDRPETFEGVVVPSRQRAVADAAGQAELALFPNDAGVAGSSYSIAIYNAAGGLLYQTRAVFPASDTPLDLYAYADNPIAPAVSVTEQQMREIRAARAGIVPIGEQARADARQASSAASATAADRLAVAQLRTEAADDREAVAADRRIVVQRATDAAQSAASAGQAARQTTDDQSATSKASATATDAADRAETAASRLEQLLIENNALRQLVEAEHGRPLVLHGERY